MNTEPNLPRYAVRQAETCVLLLQAVADAVSEGRPADRALHQLLRQHREFGSRDRRLFGDAVFTWLRWYGWIHELPLTTALPVAWFLDAQTDWPPALLAMMQDLDVDSPNPLPPGCPLEDRHAAAEEAFGVALQPFEHLLPRWLIEGLIDGISVDSLFSQHVHRPATWLRIDKTADETVHAQLRNEGGEAEPGHNPLAYAFQSSGAVSRCLHAHPAVLEIQDLASQQVVRVCSPQPGERWWDACCGTGGKSLHLLDAADRSLDLTATDRRESVFPEFKKRTRRHGLGKTRHYALDLSKEDSLLPNIAFDGILVDAPCTGSGTWARNPDGPWRAQAKDLRQLPQRQLRILNKVFPALKPGGKLVYAVCSWTKAETTDVVNAFLQSTPDCSLLPQAHPLTGAETDGTILVTPEDSKGDAMFIAVFVKAEE